jgi:pimeloyl-ACP methyl ester carboxylesterase
MPGRSVVILPGLGNNSSDYRQLAMTLRSRYGMHVEVAPVSRLDWTRNAAGLLDGAYWSGSLCPRPTVDWYLQRIDSAVNKARSACPDKPITLLAHSAGGWLGRVFMLDYGTSALGIDRFVSLGSPHQPPPPGVVDQTRGILTWVSNECPGTFHEDVQYVTIAGRFIRGASLLGPGNWQQRIVGAGYKQVCGEAEVWGDGIVPLPTAMLEGALQLTLDRVYHSPLGAQEVVVAVDGENSIDKTANEMYKISLFQTPLPDLSVDEGEIEDASRTSSLSPADSFELKVTEGPRLWYGSDVVLENWVSTLTDSKSLASVDAL